VVAPKGQSKEGIEVMEIKLYMPDGTILIEKMRYGDLKLIPLNVGKTAEIEVHPKRGMDMGEGPNKVVKGTVYGGEVGILIDTRGRPMSLPERKEDRLAKILEWNNKLDLYDV